MLCGSWCRLGGVFGSRKSFDAFSVVKLAWQPLCTVPINAAIAALEPQDSPNHTIASEKDNQMPETMIKNRNLPNTHLFEPFSGTRAYHHPSSQLIYHRRLFLKLFEAYIVSYFS